LHRYIRDWRGKHPAPLDFFGSMNTGSGRNLDWFWRRWFYDGGYPDLGITGLRHKNGSTSVIVVNKGSKPVPIDLSIEFTDGSGEKIHRSVAVWEKGDKEAVIAVLSRKSIRKVTLGSTYTPDSHPEDNVWPAK
jgi:aminopeptidase N